VKAYAYEFAQDLVNSAVQEFAEYFNPPLNTVHDQDQTTARDIAVSILTPQQLEEAEQLAKNLVKGNTNCCIWVWSVE